MRRQGAAFFRSGLVLHACAAAAFAASAALAAAPTVAEWEREFFVAVNGLHTGWWWVLWPLMQAGSLLAAPVAGAAAALKGRKLLAAQLTGGGLAGWALARVTKAVVQRPRPPGLLPGVIVPGGEVDGLGYPSGHVTVATALAVLCAAHLPLRWRPVPFAIVGAVALGRMAAGAHLPLDLVGGVLLGLLVAALTRVVSRSTCETKLRA